MKVSSQNFASSRHFHFISATTAPYRPIPTDDRRAWAVPGEKRADTADTADTAAPRTPSRPNSAVSRRRTEEFREDTHITKHTLSQTSSR